jgi:hypothetical protein
VRHGAEGIETGRDEIHQRLRPGKHRLKQDEQQAKQNEQAGDRMQQHGIHPSGQRFRPRRRADGNADDAIRLALGGAQVGRGRRLPGVWDTRVGGARSHRIDAPH